MTDPYRTSSPPIQEKEKRSMFPRKVPTFGYIVACAASLGGGGMLCQYLSRDLHEGHASVSSVFVGFATFVMALYFGFRGLASMSEDEKRAREAAKK